MSEFYDFRFQQLKSEEWIAKIDGKKIAETKLAIADNPVTNPWYINKTFQKSITKSLQERYGDNLNTLIIKDQLELVEEYLFESWKNYLHLHSYYERSE